MPLDSHVKSLLDALAAANRPKTWQLSPAEARNNLSRLALHADAKDVPIGEIENATLPGPAGPLAYRAYTPANAGKGPLAGLMFFHGGGFVIGTLDTGEGVCRLLANASGCRVISVDYRLAPEHKFPAGLDDCFAATAWVAANAASLGIDARRLAVSGDSAGGNLAAVVCQLAKKAGAPHLALQLLLCPRTDAKADTPSIREFAEGYLLEKASMDWFANHYGAPDEGDPRVSPLRAPDLSGLPPAHIHTAEFDVLRDEGKAYADALAAAGVPVQYTCHPGMIHYFYSLGGAVPYARDAVTAIGAAVGKALADGARSSLARAPAGRA